MPEDGSESDEEDDVAVAEELEVAEVDDINPGFLLDAFEAWKHKEEYESSGDEGIADCAIGPKESGRIVQECYLKCMFVVSMLTKEDPRRPYIHAGEKSLVMFPHLVYILIIVISPHS